MPHTTTNNILDITDSPIRNVPERQQLEKWSQQWQDIKQFMVLKSQFERAKEINEANANEKNSDSENQAYVQTGEPVLENQGLFHQQENAHYEQSTAKADVEKLETRIAATSRAIEHKLVALRDELNNALCNVGLVAPWSDERSKSKMYQTGDNVLIPLTLRMLDNLLLMKESNYFDFEARHYYGCVSPLSLGLSDTAEISGVMDDLVNQVSDSQRISADDVNNPAHQNPLDEYIEALTKRLLKVREKLVSELEINESETEKATAKSNIKEAIREQVGEGVQRSRNKGINDIDNEITRKLRDFVHQVRSANFFIQSPMTYAARLELLTIMEESVSECIASYHREKRAQHYLDDYYALVFRRADSMTGEELRELFFRHNRISENARYLLLSAASVLMIQKLYSKRHLLDGYVHVWCSPCVKYQGDTVMIPACAKGDDKVVKKLIDARIDVNAKDISGQTALMHAAKNQHESVIEKLIEAGADVNARNKYGRTALMMAVVSGAREMGMFDFLPVGENMPVGTEIVNKRGEEALKAARDHYGLICMENQERIVEYLLKNGADIFATNEDGETAFDIANARGNTKIARMLENAQIAATDMQPRFEPGL